MSGRLKTFALRILVLLLVIVAGWGTAHLLDPRVNEDDVHQMRQAAAVDAGEDFLQHYVESDGRVVRRDEGGDVVSEGQAYGMLIAVAVGDEERFRAIWDWTRSNLRRPDGLLSWRWSGGAVTDVNSAADADLDAARALILAGRNFAVPEWSEDGKRMGADVMRAETVAVGVPAAPPADVAPAGHFVVGSGRISVAGNWATTAPHVVEPGYFSPRADREILLATADRRWLDVSRSQRVLAWQLVGAKQLPPDWASVNPAGHAVPTGSPAGAGVQFGLDAARLPIRFAESCDPEDRALAASMRPLLAVSGDVPAIRNLDGSAASDWQHPLTLVSAAATEQAAGDDEAAAARLDRASALQQRFPTYYGAAWVALGRLMLSTPLLGDCPDRGSRFLQPS